MGQFENFRSEAPYEPEYIMEDYDDDDTPTGHPLDSEEAQRKLGRLNDWWYQCRVAASENRTEMAVDDDFVDGLQWSDDDAAELEDRGQHPSVFNECKPAIEWIIGTEKRTKVDWKVFPRTDEDRKDAEIKTKMLKYISDVNKAEFKRSAAFASASRVGVGWLEAGIRQDTEDEPIFIRNESWRNIWYDHVSTESDLSDARYLFRSKILDLDIAKAMFPERATALYEASEALDRLPYITEDDFFDSQLYYSTNSSPRVRVDDALGATHGRREVVRLIECWYREPTRVKLMRTCMCGLNGKEYDESSEHHQSLVNDGYASLFDAVRMKIRVAVFIDGGCLLQDMQSPYKHNRFPFVPIWAYRRARDNQPYGPTRNMRDPQMDLNKRRSKALFLLSVNRTVMDKGAVDDIDQYEEEVSRPNAIIEKNQGKELNIETNVQLAEEHIMLANQDGEYIRQSSGVTGENLGLETNAASGKAIIARQNQGTVVTASLFDNARLATQLTGEIILSLVEQFYTDEKTIRIVGERGQQEFVSINQYDPATGEYLNDITRSTADFKVDEQDYRESYRMAMFEQMMDMISKLDSQTALQLLDMVFEFSDLPGKEEMVQRIRKLNGQPDPDDSDADEATRMRDMQNEQMQQQQAELAIREALAKVRSLEARADRDEAGAHETKMKNMMDALETALQTLAVPGAVPTAQALFQGAKQDIYSDQAR